MIDPDLTVQQRILNSDIWKTLGDAVKRREAEWDDVIHVLKRSVNIAESNKEIGLYRPDEEQV